MGTLLGKGQKYLNLESIKSGQGQGTTQVVGEGVLRTENARKSLSLS